jgi:hypothetical protein
MLIKLKLMEIILSGTFRAASTVRMTSAQLYLGCPSLDYDNHVTYTRAKCKTFKR